MSAQTFFTDAEKVRIEAAIEAAEKVTTGEIRLHVETQCPGELKKRVVEMFYTLGMQDTIRLNGVLLYLSLEDRQFAVIGDKGIDQNVKKDYWKKLYLKTSKLFTQKSVTEGLVWCIQDIGRELAKYFPITPDDINERDNAISFGD